MLKLFCSKPFQNTLNYASTANIEELIKFYNLGDKTFETDFNIRLKAYKHPKTSPVTTRPTVSEVGIVVTPLLELNLFKRRKRFGNVSCLH